MEKVGVKFMAENTQSKICLKCGKRMEEGYIPDRGIGLQKLQANFPVWVSGKLEKSFLGYSDLDGKTTINVKTFRCQNCGYLESYAEE